MDLHEAYFCDFLWHYERVRLDYLQSAPSPLQDPYVVLAHVVRVVSATAIGVELKVRDHTGTAPIALRGEAAYHFYEEHLRMPDLTDPITDPFALNGTWFETYLFRINSTSRTTVNGEDYFIVPQICMHKEVIEQFCENVMEEETYQSYNEAITNEIPFRPGNGNNDIEMASLLAGPVGLGMGFRQRIYAPYRP